MSHKNRNILNNNKKTNINPKPSFIAPKPTTKEKKPFVITNNVQIIMSVLTLIIFIATAAYLLIAKNSDVLFMAQDRNLFVRGSEFLMELSNKPGYFIAWAGCYLTQYFYKPELGATIMITLWCCIYLLQIYTFKLTRKWAFLAIIPVACLLISVIDLGYWIYYIKHPGYYFRETLGFLIAIAFTGVIIRIKNIFVQGILTVFLAIVGYPLLGWYSVLVMLYVIGYKCLDTESSKLSKINTSAIAIISIIVVPLAFYNFHYTEIRIEDAWSAGFPMFCSDSINQISLEYPFIVMSIVPILFPIITRFTKKVELKNMVGAGYIMISVVISAIAVPYICIASNFDDYNYRAEMRMYKYTDESNWDKVLEESANYETTPTREMVILNHIAIMNKGTLGTSLFRYNNFGKAPKTDTLGIKPIMEENAEGVMVQKQDDKGNALNDTLMLHVHMVQTAGPLIYYNHAKTNFASRWCIENSVEFGYSISTLKILAKCALVNGEWDVARRYLKILQNTKYYEDWANNYMKIVENPKTIKNYHEFDYILELYQHMGTTLDGDNGLCEMYLLNYFSNTMNKDSKLLQELTLAYSLIQKDIQLFWPRFFLYAQLHSGDKMPKHYQEAAFLYGNLEHNVNIQGMPFDEDVPQRYSSFQQVSQNYIKQGMNAEQVGKAMLNDFGDTFWWFYFFCRDVKSY